MKEIRMVKTRHGERKADTGLYNGGVAQHAMFLDLQTFSLYPFLL